MRNPIVRTYYLDEDRLEVTYYYDAKSERHFGDYPDFEEDRRYTPEGRPWVNVTEEGCPYSNSEYGDCGSCGYILRERPQDLIGVCSHPELQKKEIV